MAYITDSSESFTITLTALLEGVGILWLIEVVNETTGLGGIWEYGTWYTPIPAVTEGDSIYVGVSVINNGATVDTLFGEFSSAQVTVSSPLMESSTTIPIGQTFGPQWSFTMPATNVSITINAGHVEGVEGGPVSPY